MIKTSAIRIRNVPEPVAQRLRVLATVLQTRQGAVLGMALAKLEGKEGCPGCGVWIEDDQAEGPVPQDQAHKHAEGCWSLASEERG